jgi:hypothetical protein
MVRDGQTLPASTTTTSVRLGGVTTTDVADVDRIGAEFANGATLVMQSLERLHPPLVALARELEAEISHRVQANAYLSPPDAAGLARHADRHDVFVVQLEGAKSWKVDELGAVELVEGDVMYIPRGCAHAASTNAHHSLHLTIGVLSVTYGDVIRRLVNSLGDRFDRALPLGFADESMHAELAAAIGDACASAAAELGSADLAAVAHCEQERSRRGHARPNRLRQELALLELNEHSTLRLCRGASMAATDDTVELRFGDRSLRMPHSARSALETLLDADMVVIGDLSGLNPPSRLVLARRLVREGAAELVD